MEQRMGEPRLRPQPDELWRTYEMTPFGPGAISTLARVVDIAHDHLVRRNVVRYQYVHPVETDRVDTMTLDRFVDSRVAPYETEADWMRRRDTAPDEEPTP